MSRPAEAELLRHAAFPRGLRREDLLAWFRKGRERTRRIFSIPRPEVYYERPIALRNPIVFYEGHIPAFAINTLIKLALGQPGIDEDYEILFARGIDPADEAGVADPAAAWPRPEDVSAYVRAAEALIERALTSAPLDDDVRIEAALNILEHEPMHQETLLYMFHNLSYHQKATPPEWRSPSLTVNGQPLTGRPVRIPAGVATLGADRAEIGFGWDNEFPRHQVGVAAFEIDRHNVTNGDYLRYMNETGAPAPYFWTRREEAWFWRGMFELIPLPLSWPVYVTQEEATAYAHWRGARLPTEPEYHRAAFGTPSGKEVGAPTEGNFDFRNWDPVPVGSYPPNAWGIHDLVGNGWEWTSTPFAGFEGFEPMRSYPSYSVDFFDGQHFVLKGASPATARELIRPSFRNWFRPNYPYLYATFRCVRQG